MEVEKQIKPVYLMSGFWLIIMFAQGLWWMLGWGFNEQWFNVYLILFIILRRIEWECDGNKPWVQWFSKN